MNLINADTLVHVSIYDDQTEETTLDEMSIADLLNTFADEGCPPAQPEQKWTPVNEKLPERTGITLEQVIDDFMDRSKGMIEVAESESNEANKKGALYYAGYYKQVAEFLKELAERRKLSEIIFCKDCEKHNKRFDEYPADEACPLTVWRVAQEHEFDYQFCAYAERRTDEAD